MTKPRLPGFLTQSTEELLSKFNTIERLESERIHDGINNPESIWTLFDAAKAFKLKRNRYSNVLPFDYNRVQLATRDQNCSDYINGSHIKVNLAGFPKTRYIATQGPMARTTSHFWSMCFQEAEANDQDDILVVMVTPLREGNVTKCHQYWPSEASTVIPGIEDGLDDYQLTVIRQDEEFEQQGIHQTTLELTNNETQNTKTVHHIYFDKWEDFNRPAEIGPILTIIQLMNRFEEVIPIIHCSAGVGRTGTLISLHYFLKYVYLTIGNLPTEEIGERDYVEEIVLQLRIQRMLMVQSSVQYLFLYKTIKGLFSNKFEMAREE